MKEIFKESTLAAPDPELAPDDSLTVRYELRVLVGFKRAHMWSPKVKPRIAGNMSTERFPKEL